MTTRYGFSEQNFGLHPAMVNFHAFVIGHGLIISDFETRGRWVELAS